MPCSQVTVVLGGCLLKKIRRTSSCMCCLKVISSFGLRDSAVQQRRFRLSQSDFGVFSCSDTFLLFPIGPVCPVQLQRNHVIHSFGELNGHAMSSDACTMNK